MKFCAKCGVASEDVGPNDITECNGQNVCSQCRSEEPSCLSADLDSAKEELVAWRAFATDLYNFINKCHKGCAHKHACNLEFVVNKLSEIL